MESLHHGTFVSYWVCYELSATACLTAWLNIYIVQFNP